MKQQVSDDFSKAKDPIDQYNEINVLAKVISKREGMDIRKKDSQFLIDAKATQQAE